MSAEPEIRRLLELDGEAHNAAAALYWEAFAGKLGRLLGARGLDVVRAELDPSHAFAAFGPSGEVLGVAGFRSPDGSFVTLSPEALRTHYGRFGGKWRSLALKLLGEDVESERFLIDGLAVAPAWRGRGLGRALLARLAEEARRRGYPALRLDVANTNPRAQALYTRCGYKVIARQSVPLARPVFGVSSCDVMELRLVD